MSIDHFNDKARQTPQDVDPEALRREMAGIQQVDDRGEYGTLPLDADVDKYPVLLENAFNPGEHDKKKKVSKFKLAGAGIALAAVLGGGIGVYAHAKGGETPRPQPTAGAGVAPTEAAPTPSVGETAVQYNPEDPSTWTADNIVLDFNGEKLSGVKAFKDAVSVKVEDYPTAEEAFPVMIDRFNQWINYGNTVQQDKDNKGFISPDQQSTGMRAITDTFVDPAFEQALAGSGNEFTNFLKDIHREAIGEWSPEDQTYTAKLSVERTVNTNPIHATLVYTSTKLEQERGESSRLLLHTTLVKGEDGNWQMIENTGYETLDK